jgi:hypothetical protein
VADSHSLPKDKLLAAVYHEMNAHYWCGIGKRSKPLEYWQVFLLGAKSEIIGVSGPYRQPGTPSHLSCDAKLRQHP